MAAVLDCLVIWFASFDWNGINDNFAIDIEENTDLWFHYSFHHFSNSTSLSFTIASVSCPQYLSRAFFISSFSSGAVWLQIITS